MVIIFMEVKYPRVTYRCQDIFVYLYSERMAQSQRRLLCDVFESHTLGRFPARLGLERTTGGRGAYLQIGSHLSTHPGPHSQCGPNGKKIPRVASRGKGGMVEEEIIYICHYGHLVQSKSRQIANINSAQRPFQRLRPSLESDVHQ